MPTTPSPQRIRIHGEDHFVTADAIVAVARAEFPRRINAYFVEIDGKRFPPKQLLRGAVPTTRSFDTGVAVRALRTLGFQVVKLADS